jgi:hypothetical protein
MNELNRLEKAVLNWVSENSDNSALTAQIATATLTKREWTKVGFHIEITVDSNCSAVDLSFPISGPEIEHGACSLIWGKNGYINGIELAAYGDFFGEVVSQFSLQI